MSNLLSALFSDFRLYDLFGNDQNLTVSQIWVLEIEWEGSSELRFLYGRSLPSDYLSNSFSGTVICKTSLDKNSSVKIHALTLYASTEHLKAFLGYFISGKSLQTASELSGLTISDKLAKAVGASIFGTTPIVRPVMHLPTRDYYQFQTNRLSPTDYASVDSGAIYSVEKPNIFSALEGHDMNVAEAVCRALDAETGMDFSKLDAWRFGDFEFICAPGLTATERKKYELSVKPQQLSFTLFEPMTQKPSDLLITWRVYSSGSTQFSCIAYLDKDTSFPLHHIFKLKEFNKEASTAYTFEIYALGSNGEQSFLLLQIGRHFMRQADFGLIVTDPVRVKGELGWLTKKVPKREKVKLGAAGQIQRATRSFRSRMGGYTKDAWVQLNRLTEKRVKELRPDKSDGRFFLTLDKSGGRSRLLLTQWLNEIFERYQDAQIAWIDPYMEDVGIQLLNRLGTHTADYLIITTERETSDENKGDAGKPSRVENLLASCSDWSSSYFGNVCLKVLTVPAKTLHDRMILVRSANGQPLAGYQLSNSVQRASENLPLLATPIPLDVIPKVFEYTDQMIQSTLYGDGKAPPTARLIFNSAEVEQEPSELDQPPSFVVSQRAGDVLAWWLDDAQLSGLSGPVLIEQMHANGYIKDLVLDPERFGGLPVKFWSEGFPLTDFHSAWDALGDILAHSRAGDFFSTQQWPLPELLKQALLDHISSIRPNALPPRLRKSHLDIHCYLSQDLFKLLISNWDPFSVFKYSPVDTSWSDYYAIKLLWSQAPNQLVSWLSTLCSGLTEDPRAHALVIEAIKHICFSVSFKKHHEQINALLQSNVSVIVLVGLYALQDAINAGDWGSEEFSKIDKIQPASLRLTILCWLINNANCRNSDTKSQIITLLTQSIQEPLTDEQFGNILNAVRDPRGRLQHVTPWILESMLVPMLEQGIIDIAQVAGQWSRELTIQWQAALKNDRLYFKRESGGAFTDELAVLIKYLSASDREKIFRELRKVFDVLARIIRKPMSATVCWNLYSNAHYVNFWLVALVRRVIALVPDEPSFLGELLHESEAIIERIHLSTWWWEISNELITYMEGDPNQIKEHSSHQFIQNIVVSH